MLEHDRFEEFASLEAIGELSPEEQEEFLRHKITCPKCREIVAETSSLAATAFLIPSIISFVNNRHLVAKTDTITKAASTVDFPALFGPTSTLKWRSGSENFLNALKFRNSTLT